MSKKVVALGSAVASVALALGVGFGVASATEPSPQPSGDNCTVNGNFNVVVAPNCQAGQATAPTTTTQRPTAVPVGPGRPTLPPIDDLPPIFTTSTTRSGGFFPQPFP